MKEISYTLLSEGTSDRALIPILDWLLRQYFNEYAIQHEWSDLTRLPVPPKSLPERIERSLELYPCDILFVHRDADNQGLEKRVKEIDTAWSQVNSKIESTLKIHLIHVIPVRATESWLILNEEAIRRAADNPRGNVPLIIPAVKTLEDLSDPKTKLQDLLKQASGASGRKLRRFNERAGDRMVRITEAINDFSFLRQLSAFQRLEACVKSLVGRV